MSSCGYSGDMLPNIFLDLPSNFGHIIQVAPHYHFHCKQWGSEAKVSRAQRLNYCKAMVKYGWERHHICPPLVLVSKKCPHNTVTVAQTGLGYFMHTNVVYFEMKYLPLILSVSHSLLFFFLPTPSYTSHLLLSPPPPPLHPCISFQRLMHWSR